MRVLPASWYTCGCQSRLWHMCMLATLHAFSEPVLLASSPVMCVCSFKYMVLTCAYACLQANTCWRMLPVHRASVLWRTCVGVSTCWTTTLYLQLASHTPRYARSHAATSKLMHASFCISSIYISDAIFVARAPPVIAGQLLFIMGLTCCNRVACDPVESSGGISAIGLLLALNAAG